MLQLRSPRKTLTGLQQALEDYLEAFEYDFFRVRLGDRSGIRCDQLARLYRRAALDGAVPAERIAVLVHAHWEAARQAQSAAGAQLVEQARWQAALKQARADVVAAVEALRAAMQHAPSGD